MKRHEELIPYSRFHRKILFLALIAKKNAPAVKGYPTETEEKINYALTFYKQELKDHFLTEENELFKTYENQDKEVDLLINELKKERATLKLLFQSLENTKEETTLNRLGELLEKHVRKEERSFFELLQHKFLS